MLLKEIIVIKQDSFEVSIQNWATQNSIPCQVSETSYEDVDAVVLFHENHTVSKDNKNIQLLFKEQNKFSHSIDVNGTLMASVSSFVFWLEEHKPKQLLFIGDNNLSKNEKFDAYLNKLQTRLS